MGKKHQSAICIFGANFMLDQLGSLQSEIDGAMDGSDIEYIHRMRVASRRMRNGLTCFKECLPGKNSKSWRDEVRRITHALGNARDLDIQMDSLNKLYNDRLDPMVKPGYQRILLRLKQRRTVAQKKVVKTLAKFQKSEILSDMHEKLEEKASSAENRYLYTPSLYQKAFKNINARLEDFLMYQEDVQVPENVEKLHAMRIAGKQLRYTLEIFAPIYNTALLPYIQIMKDLQDQLGSIHDDDVWVSWLPKFIEEEEQRIDDYFGNTGPLDRLLPGINHLIENRQNNREKTYQSFLDTWRLIEGEDAWESLKKIINAPIRLEDALEHLAETESPTDEEQEEDQALSQEMNSEMPEEQLLEEIPNTNNHDLTST